MSGTSARFRKRRDKIRRECLAGYRNATLANSTFFFVGLPSTTRDLYSTKWGLTATSEEVQQAQLLLREAEEYRDIVVLSHRDLYRDLPTKTWEMLRWGRGTGADFFAKVDDDVCLDVDVTKRLLRNHTIQTPSSGLYLGYYALSGSRSIMKGRDGLGTPYMEGPAYVLSRNVLDSMFKSPFQQSVTQLSWVTSGLASEDAMVGRWAAEVNKTIPVMFQVDDILKWGDKAHWYPKRWGLRIILPSELAPLS